MNTPLKHLILLCVCICIYAACLSQDSTSFAGKVLNFPTKFFNKVNSKTADLDKQLTNQTAKYVSRLTSREAKLKRKLSKLDSNAAKDLYAGNPGQQYDALLQKLKKDSASVNRIMSGSYFPYADSLQATLAFLNKNPQLLNLSKVAPADIQQSLNQLKQLEAKMQDADQVQQYILQRKEQIKQYLSKYTHLPAGITNIYTDYNKDLYYYSAQVKAYEDMINSPDRLFQTALVLLNKLPVFANFVRKNSFLSSLLNIPATNGIADSAKTTASGMHTRDQVTSLIQSKLGSGGPNITAFTQQKVQSAEGQIDQLRNKLTAFGSGGGEIDIPNFIPNNQKTRNFFRRLEYGTSFQTTPGSYYFPNTTALGLTIAYQLDSKNDIGIGASYLMGWNPDIRHININSQGFGLKSFVDIQLKKSFFISGGLEFNYENVFTSFQQINSLSKWIPGGLIGISKIISVNTKVFKKTKLQLLWDFLSYQAPRTAPLIFRVSYDF